MASKNNIRGILSLSAASMALLQGTGLAQGTPPETSTEPCIPAAKQLTSQTDNLILAPPFQEKLNQLYAGHSSHASHASHSSHVSGMSDYSVPSTPYYPPPEPPVTAPAPTPPAPKPKPLPQEPVNSTNAPAAATDKTAPTDAPSAEQLAKNKEHIDTLTKQAAEGSAYAQYSLGICYLYGSEGAETNAEKAKMLLELSAVQGNAFAKQKLDELQPDTQKPATP